MPERDDTTHGVSPSARVVILHPAIPIRLLTVDVIHRYRDENKTRLWVCYSIQIEHKQRTNVVLKTSLRHGTLLAYPLPVNLHHASLGPRGSVTKGTLYPYCKRSNTFQN